MINTSLQPLRRLPRSTSLPLRRYSAPHQRGHARPSRTHRRCRAGPEPHDEYGDAGSPSTSGRSSGGWQLRYLQQLDMNQLQTALNTAIAGENYTLAAKIRDVLAAAVGTESTVLAADWRKLGILDWLAERAEYLGYKLPTEVQKRSAPVILDRDDCIIQSSTGSGKTLSFVLPMLSCLDYPPEVYPDDLKGPQAVVIVPTRELGVQVVMLIYKLFGGSVNQGIPGAGGNIFNYSGPRGLKVKGVLLEEELELVAKEGYLRGAHVVVGTPELLARAMAGEEGSELMRHTKVVAVDEVDMCFQDHIREMSQLINAACSQPSKPTLALVGATLGQGLGEDAVARGWLVDPVRVVVGEGMRVPSGLSHRYMVVDEQRKLAAMCRQMRLDLRGQGEDAAPARVMVFAASEPQAVALADPLRTVLWGDHKISVLLPNGTEPITALHSFRDNKATLLLATPAAARGLDLPAVSHVYNFSPPLSATDYLHRAGRAGRIGSPVPGLITTLVTPDEENHLLELACQLDIELVREEEPGPEVDLSNEAAAALEAAGEGSGGPSEGELDKLRSGLEDLFNLF